ncbi:MAG: 2'-5' RNA ligase family protein [Actinomycetota bacterium]
MPCVPAEALVAALDDQALLDAHQRACDEEHAACPDVVEAHHALVVEAARRGLTLDTLCIEPMRKVAVLVDAERVEVAAALAKADDLPVAMIAALRDAHDRGVAFADVLHYLTWNGYELAVVPLDETDPTERGALDRLTLGSAAGARDTGDHSGAMVALYLAPEAAAALALEGHEKAEDLHITLVYLGEARAYTRAQRLAVITAVASAVRGPLVGRVGGVGKFTNEDADVHWAAPDVPGLAELHERVVAALADVAVEPQGMAVEHGWTPHITLAYATPGTDLSVEAPAVDLVFERVTVEFGDERVDLDLTPAWDLPEEIWESAGPLRRLADALLGPRRATGAAPLHFRKDAVRRFTLGPWYVPGQADAHGEWTDADTLQAALWDYVRGGDRRVRLQHNTDVVAGEWVEAVTWPHEVTVPMTRADGTTTEVTYPANTVFLGVVWEPWAWDLVETGRLNGFSIGGKAVRQPTAGPQ